MACVTNCPAFLIPNGTTGICDSCYKVRKYYDAEVARACVARCPIYLIPNPTTGKCDNCKTNNLGFSYGTACVAGNSCPALSAVVDQNRNGCKSCLSQAKFYDDESQTCVDTCPEFLIRNTNTGNCDNCKTLKLGYSDSVACIAGSRCPIGLKLINSSRNGCATCPSGQVIQDGSCVDTCNLGYVPDYDKTCKKCPTEAPYFLNNACVASCGYLGYDVNTLVCYNCKIALKYWFNGQCVDSIPSATALKLTEFAAYVTCGEMSPQQYKYNGNCVADCPNGKYKFPPKAECSSSSCYDYNAFIDNNMCVTACPAKTAADPSTNQCVSGLEIYYGNIN